MQTNNQSVGISSPSTAVTWLFVMTFTFAVDMILSTRYCESVAESESPPHHHVDDVRHAREVHRRRHRFPPEQNLSQTFRRAVHRGADAPLCARLFIARQF